MGNNMILAESKERRKLRHQSHDFYFQLIKDDEYTHTFCLYKETPYI